jgi:hypothetical protein
VAALRKFDPSGPEDRLVKVYRDAYAELLKTIERKEARGNITVYEHSLLADVQRILSGIDKDMKGWVERDLPLIYQGAAENVYEAYTRAGVELPPFNTSFAKAHEQAVRVLADNLTNNLNEATSFVGRRINDQFRKISIEVITSKTATGKTVREAKKLLMQEIGDSGLGAFVDRKDRQWRLDTYSEMVVRSTTREATNTGLMDQ